MRGWRQEARDKPSSRSTGTHGRRESGRGRVRGERGREQLGTSVDGVAYTIVPTIRKKKEVGGTSLVTGNWSERRIKRDWKFMKKKIGLRRHRKVCSRVSLLEKRAEWEKDEGKK